MVGTIALTAIALRAGLALRRARAKRRRITPEMRRAHLRVAKPAVALALIGFAAGPVSAIWLRGWEPFGTFHGWLGGCVAALFVFVAVLGHRLEHGRGRPLDAHAIAGGVAVLLAAVSAVAGFVLLP